MTEVPWSGTPLEVAARLGTDPVRGLQDDIATQRARAAPNVLTAERPRSIGSLVREQLRDTFILLLLGSCVVAALVGDVKDTAVIATVVIVNTGLGVRQGRRAQRALAELRSLTATSTRVLRDGRTLVVPTEQIAVGDLLVLAAGDLVPADARVVTAERLAADEALLTGESIPAGKDSAVVLETTPVAERSCMLHAGTAITRGSATALVTATGVDSEVGRIAEALRTAVAPATPMQRQLARLGRQVAAVAVGVCLAVVAIGLLQGEPWETMLITGTSLAVAAVPESLPAVVAVSLAIGAQRMARRFAVVRSLPAIEALGAVTVIATDKTGTLTEGTVEVATTWTTGASEADLLRALVLCNDAELVDDGFVGDPLDAALLVLAVDRDVDAEAHLSSWPRSASEPFDPATRRMTTTHTTGDEVLVVCKGAPEVVLPLVGDEALRAAADHEVERLSGSGLRVLAVAESRRTTLPADREDAEQGLQLLGLVALHDPVRPDAAAAVASCRAAGITAILVTGDHLGTAVAVAQQVGIPVEHTSVGVPEDLLSSGPVPTVFARTAPEDKLTVVQALQRRGHVVAMTGDGVNDAPALRRADVGVAMGRSGTEVARQAADVVLLDDDFATLVAAVAEGRRVFDSIRRFLLYAMSGGAAELLVMLVGPALGLALPLLPAQVLWVNLLTHGPPGVALGAGAPSTGVLDRPPRDPRRGIVDRGLAQALLGLGALIGTVSLATAVVVKSSGGPWQTSLFVCIAAQQLGVALALMSRGPGKGDDRPVAVAVALSAALLVGAITWAPLRDLLGTEPLDPRLLLGLLPGCALAPCAVRVLGRRVSGARRTRITSVPDSPHNRALAPSAINDRR
jgi:Ca2+-transporting ATPase